MSEVNTKSPSHKKLLMSVSRPVQIIWALRTTVWEVPAQKLQGVADRLKGTCPWECSTGGFVGKVLGYAPCAEVMRSHSAWGLRCFFSKNTESFLITVAFSFAPGTVPEKKYQLRNTFFSPLRKEQRQQWDASNWKNILIYHHTHRIYQSQILCLKFFLLIFDW